MLTAQTIITRLGGATEIARALDMPMTTVASWSVSNFIPRWWQEPLLRLALERQIALSATDFPTKEQRRSRSARVAA